MHGRSAVCFALACVKRTPPWRSIVPSALLSFELHMGLGYPSQTSRQKCCSTSLATNAVPRAANKSLRLLAATPNEGLNDD